MAKGAAHAYLTQWTNFCRLLRKPRVKFPWQTSQMQVRVLREKTHETTVNFNSHVTTIPCFFQTFRYFSFEVFIIMWQKLHKEIWLDVRENFAWVFRFHVVGIFPLQYEIESLTMPNLRSKLFALPTVIMLIQAVLQYTLHSLFLCEKCLNSCSRCGNCKLTPK